MRVLFKKVIFLFPHWKITSQACISAMRALKILCDIVKTRILDKNKSPVNNFCYLSVMNSLLQIPKITS